jgi:enamine deaminase RidA (YjgF/YER057c/UK114 family)
MRRLISSGSILELEIGYSRAVVDGDWVFVSGTTGFDYQTMSISENVMEQAEQCMRNIEKALAEAGSGFATSSVFVTFCRGSRILSHVGQSCGSTLGT